MKMRGGPKRPAARIGIISAGDACAPNTRKHSTAMSESKEKA